MFQFWDWLCRDWVQSKGESEGCGTFGFRISYAFLSCCLNWFLLIDHARAHHPRSLPPTNVTHSPNQEQMFMLQVLWFLPPLPLGPPWLSLWCQESIWKEGVEGNIGMHASWGRGWCCCNQTSLTGFTFPSKDSEYLFKISEKSTQLYTQRSSDKTCQLFYFLFKRQLLVLNEFFFWKQLF